MQQNNEKTSNDSEKARDPDEWTTGSEPISPKQKSYLQTVQDEPVKESLSNATASNMIDAATKNEDSAATKNESTGGKDRGDWVNGSEEMTDAQRSYLKTLSDQAGQSLDENQSKATASQQIEQLEHKAATDVSNEKDGE